MNFNRTNSDPTEKTTLWETVAANIRAYAGVANISRADMARALGVARPTVGRKWNGEAPWSLVDLEIVAEVLGVTPADLITPHAYEKASQRDLLRGLPSQYTAWDSNPEPAD